MNELMTMGFLGGSMSGGEILLVLVAILVLFGSKNIPHIARTIGKSLEEFRRAGRSVTDEIMRSDVRDEPPPARLHPTGTTAPVKTDAAASAPAAQEPELVPKPSAHAVQRNHEPPA